MYYSHWLLNFEGSQLEWNHPAMEIIVVKPKAEAWTSLGIYDNLVGL